MDTKSPIPPRVPSSSHDTPAGAVRVAFGQVLAEHRERAGFQQRVFSRVTGISNSHLRSIEQGTVSPTLITLWKICAALDEDPSMLVLETRQRVAKIVQDGWNTSPPE